METAIKNEKNKIEIYTNTDSRCECWRCELQSRCLVESSYKRLPLEYGGLGQCRKLKKD